MLDLDRAIVEFESLDRRLLKTISERPIWDLSKESDRSEVRRIFVESQGFDKIPMPEISYECVSEEIKFGCRVQKLTGTSWENCALASHLFLPLSQEKCPVVLCACGHGDTKLGYAKMAITLAQRGIACLVPDNMGQLERAPMGHWLETAPFDCGFSFMAMLTTEQLANLNWLKKDDRFTNIGIAGNSGGGTLSMCLAAIAPEWVDAISSSGYPSSFEWICRKRKRHCACNLFPGVLGKIEHEDLYSLFAPRPLRLMMGVFDNLIPLDVFRATEGRVGMTYKKMNCSENFTTAVWHGPHPWNKEAAGLNADFFAEIFKLDTPKREPDDEVFELEDFSAIGNVYDKYPDWAVSTAELAYRFAGKAVPDKIPELEDIWKCESSETYPELYPSGTAERIMAQWRCFIDGFQK